VTAILIRAQVEPEQRRELMQMCRTWLSDQLPTACLERRVYEDAISQTNLLLIESWLSTEAMYSSLSTEGFRALIGAIKVLGTLVNVCISETRVLEVG
jgi:quinol monooxygenase YgiN